MAPKRDSAARIGIPSSIGSRARPRSGVVVHYIGGGTVPRGRHSQCRAQVRGWHRYHRSGNGWAGLGYHYLVCHHGTVMVGRGLNRVGSHAPGVNSSHIGVCFMLGGGQKPTAKQLAGFRRLRRWLARKGVRASNISPHSRHYSTSCPGNRLRRRIRRGRWGGGTKQGGEDVPTYVSISKDEDSRTEELVSGEWHQIYFNDNNSKGCKGHHADGDWPSLLRGPVDYTGYISLRLSGVPVGTECKARAVEVTSKGDKWEVVERDRPLEFAGTSGDTFAVLPVAGHVGKNRRLRVEVLHYGDDDVTATVVAGEVRVLTFER